MEDQVAELEAQPTEWAASTPMRRWAWITLTVAGLVAATVAWLVISFSAFFAAGGTFGGYGENGDAHVDWGRLALLNAAWVWIPAAIAGAVPAVWAWTSARRAASTNARRHARWTLAAVIVLAVAAAAVPAIEVVYQRRRAEAPESAVVAALARNARAPIVRSIVKPESDSPWIRRIRSSTPVAPRVVAADVPAAAGRWVCWPRDRNDWWFEPANGGRWTSLTADAGSLTVDPAPRHPPVRVLESCL